MYLRLSSLVSVQPSDRSPGAADDASGRASATSPGTTTPLLVLIVSGRNVGATASSLPATLYTQ